MSWADSENLGPESLLGDASMLDDAADGRDRLALALRYLANWYRATKDSKDKELWWQRIDMERAKVERAYKGAADPFNALFWGNTMVDLYNAAAKDWPQLWRDLKLSPDTLVETTLLDKAASVLESPLAFLPTLANNIGDAIGGSIGNLTRQLFPWILLASGVGLVYVFRKPLLAAAAKVSA